MFAGPKLETLLGIRYLRARYGVDRLGSLEIHRNIFLKFQEMLFYLIALSRKQHPVSLLELQL
jgi:hypothetical protein